MNVLVLATHPGDEALGPGGSVLLHTAAGHRVATTFVVAGEGARDARESEARTAAGILGTPDPIFLDLLPAAIAEKLPTAVERLADLLRDHTPDLVYLPQPQDDDALRRATSTAFREAVRAAAGLSPTLLAYEISPPLVRYDEVADVTPMMETKLRAIRAYASLLTRVPLDRAADALNAYRGALAGECDRAEVFQTFE
jgi:LmbE family N-acetylglucosaminyl deacetylase